MSAPRVRANITRRSARRFPEFRASDGMTFGHRMQGGQAEVVRTKGL
jgi:hypothetical protein